MSVPRDGLGARSIIIVFWICTLGDGAIHVYLGVSVRDLALRIGAYAICGPA